MEKRLRELAEKLVKGQEIYYDGDWDSQWQWLYSRQAIADALVVLADKIKLDFPS